MNPLQTAIYRGSPPWLQSRLVSVTRRGARMLERGREFRTWSKLLRESDGWSRARLEEWQFERLRDTVAHAFAHVPAYRALYDEHGVHPRDLQSPGDLRRFPLVDKAMIRARPAEWLAQRPWRYRPVALNSSGTTGSPFQFYSDARTEAAERALVERHWQRAGIEPRAWVASLGGRMIVPRAQTRPPFWRWNAADRLLWLSAFHLTPEIMAQYTDLLNTSRVRFLKGYPSNLEIFANFLLSEGRRLPMESIVTGSEPLRPAVRALIEDRFGCGVYDWYGVSERCAGASQCERRDGYHEQSEVLFMEILHDPKLGSDGEMVGTSLLNRAMPLIRYRTGDVSTWAVDCTCGRPQRCIERVDTKVEDILLSADGRWLSPSVLTHPFKPIKGVKRSQIEQLAPFETVVRVVADEAFDAGQQELLVRGLQERLGTAMHIRIERVSEIPRGATGKFRWVINRMSRTGA